MLERVLEPEVMDDAQEAQQYHAMDHRETNLAFVDDLLQCCSAPRQVLDVGAGTALIPIELCRRVESCRVTAADLSREMLELARDAIDLHSMRDRIRLDLCDVKQMHYPDEMFDLVICNGMLHHIPDPLHVLAESKRVTVRGGLVFFRDLRRPDDQDELNRIVATHAAEANEQQRTMFRHSLQAALTLDEMRRYIVQLGCDPETVQATSDRHWTWAARLE